MSEQIYREVEDAISRKLHLGCAPKSMSMHGMHWHYPEAIEDGLIKMRDSDCGLAKPTWRITIEEWTERREKYGLWKSVGMWNFVPADDPAASLIAMAKRNSTWAGREIYRLRNEIAALAAANKQP